jgi:hypothetical protein
MTEERRKQLKKKIEAGEARNRDLGRTTIVDRAGEKAIEAKDKFTAFAKEHPITTVAGAVAVGVLVSALFKRSPTRKAGAKAGKKAAGLAAIGAEMAWAYAQHAMSAANEAGRDAAHRASDLGGSARDIARDAGTRIAKAVRDRSN